MRKLAGIGLAAVVLGSMFTGLPGIAHAGTTTTTFTVTAGALTISVPPSTVSLGSGLPGSTIAGPLGNVTVTDARGNIAASWTAVVAATAFTGTTYVTQTVAANLVTYTPGSSSGASGTAGVFTTGGTGTLSSGGRTAYTGTAIGSNAVTWNPNLSVAVPSTAVADTYSGTVTHTVS